ncbi:fimbrial biogenesis chaperone [Escherichia marmotae]|uniref:fimbrial biogenesis chaperone n=1 Tax=Escherichia marmotae TaxID=1499973 RepID=UPI003CF04B34
MLIKFLQSLLFLFLLPSAWADGIGINALRIIYPAGKTSVSVSLRNNTDNTWLMQSYITRVSAGKPDSQYFKVLPGIEKLPPRNESIVRMIALGNVDKLPRDKESVFYFISRGIVTSEPLQDMILPETQAGVIFSLSSQIKMFYRPEGLTTEGAEEAARTIVFNRTGTGVKIMNNSPYYVSLRDLIFGHQRIATIGLKNMGMIPPFESIDITSTQGLNSRQVSWVTFNDLGMAEMHKGRIN